MTSGRGQTHRHMVRGIKQPFIRCDVRSLPPQGVGGGLSLEADGSGGTGVSVTLVGLSFQVFTLVVFVSLGADAGASPVLLRARCRSVPAPGDSLILLRRAYRIDELSGTCFGPLYHKQGVFVSFLFATKILLFTELL